MNIDQKKIVLVVLGVIVLLAGVGVLAGGRDYQPPLWALQIELAGGSAYGEEMAERFRREYAEPFASGGFAYPLPVMWLALPIIALPDAAIGPVWCVLSVGSVLLGLVLLRVPVYLVFFLPLPLGMYLQQVTVLLTGLLLIGIWAWREQRWWLLSAIVALTIAAKPQTTFLVAATLGILALRAGAWKPLAVCGLVVAGLTFALEPTWLTQWLAAVARYRAAIGQTWVLEWLPVALVLLAMRHSWGALAVLQVSLFPTLFGYTLLPLLIGYADARTHRVALLAVVCSWGAVALVGVQPATLVQGVLFLGPLLVSGSIDTSTVRGTIKRR